MASKIHITFNDNVVAGDCITINTIELIDSTPVVSKQEAFQDTPRVASGQIQIPPFPIDLTEQTDYADGVYAAALFVNFFNMDHNNSGKFNLLRALNVVTIEHNVATRGFGVPDYCGYNGSHVIENDAYSTPFAITDVTYSTADVPCDFIKATVTLTEFPDRVWLNGVYDENDLEDNPVVVNIPRNMPSIMLFYNTAGDWVSYPLGNTPTQSNGDIILGIELSEACFNITVTPSISGATVTVNQIGIYTPTPVLQYSLNGTTWQPENIFIGQEDNPYTMHIKDQYGCTGTIDYTVNAFGTRDVFNFISKANSVGFTEQVDWDNCSVMKSEVNTMNHQKTNKLNYCEDILFNNCDSITIQFKTNLPTIEIKLREDDLTETILSYAKKTENLNKFQSMDCKIYSYTLNQTGIYFDTGQTYDINEDVIVGGDYTLNGNLPEMAIIGNYIDLGAYGVHEIVDVIYDSVINKKVILINLEYTDTQFQSWIVTSLFDLLPFEVYEFTIPWSVYGNGLYDILITLSNITETFYFLSENILIEDEHPDTIAIRYWNNNNRDIFYKYDIQHLIRVPLLDFKPGMDDDIELNITDSLTEVVSSDVNEVDEFEFDDVTVSMFRKLAIALSCENVFINNEGYAKNGSIEFENMPHTNLIKVVAKMIKTNINYTTKQQGATGVDSGYIDFNIPPFIVDDETFITE